MKEFTYENQNKQKRYETYEWDNTWIDHPNDNFMRILYIGDSISCGIRRFATEQADGKMVFDLFASSRAIDNPYFKDALTVFTNQEAKRDAILFNNGLHGFHLEDDTEYKKHYEEMVEFLLDKYKKTPIALVLTTYVLKHFDSDRVTARNKAVIEISEKYNLPVIDLYSVSKAISEYLSEDGIHFVDEGYKIFADKIIKETLQIINND